MGFANITEANGGELIPWLGFVFNGSASGELGPGSLSFAVQASPAFYFNDTVMPAQDLGADDNFIDFGYALGAGPGTLGINLGIDFDNATGFYFRPGVSYTGIEAGPATIGVGSYLGIATTGMKDGKGSAFGRDPIEGFDLAFWLDAGFDFGLGVFVEYAFNTDKSETAWLYMNFSYGVTDALSVNVELDGMSGDKLFEGFSIIPGVSYALGNNMSVGAWFQIGNINNDAGDVFFSPGLWFSYSL